MKEVPAFIQRWEHIAYFRKKGKGDPPVRYWHRVGNSVEKWPYQVITEKKIKCFSFTDIEYNQHLQGLAYEDGDHWNMQQTKELFERCKEYDLRFPVIQDRLSFSKTLEQCKRRYYTCAEKLLEIRGRLNPTAIARHELSQRPYNYKEEKQRIETMKSFYNTSLQFDQEKLDIQHQISKINTLVKDHHDMEIKNKQLIITQQPYREQPETMLTPTKRKLHPGASGSLTILDKEYMINNGARGVMLRSSLMHAEPYLSEEEEEQVRLHPNRFEKPFKQFHDSNIVVQQFVRENVPKAFDSLGIPQQFHGQPHAFHSKTHYHYNRLYHLLTSFYRHRQELETILSNEESLFKELETMTPTTHSLYLTDPYVSRQRENPIPLIIEVPTTENSNNLSNSNNNPMQNSRSPVSSASYSPEGTPSTVPETESTMSTISEDK